MSPHWDIACGLVMLFGRFIPIIAPIAIAGSLAAKKPTPFTVGTLRTDTLTFGLFLLGTILLVARCSSCRRRCWARGGALGAAPLRGLIRLLGIFRVAEWESTSRGGKHGESSEPCSCCLSWRNL